MSEEKAETPIEGKPEEAKPVEEPKAPDVSGEIEQLRSAVSKMEQNWKDAQRVISRKDEEIYKLKDNRDFQEAMLAAIAESKGGTVSDAETEVRHRMPDLKTQYQTLKARRQQEEFAEKVGSYQKIVEGDLGLRPTDDEYDIIQALVVAGKFDKADKKIEAMKAEKEKPKEPPKDEKPKESEDERIERLAKAKAAGLLKSEGGEPSATGGAVTITRADLASMPVKERHELLRTRDVTITN
jgi:hypothetical protein